MNHHDIQRPHSPHSRETEGIAGLHRANNNQFTSNFGSNLRLSAVLIPMKIVTTLLPPGL